MASSGIVLPTPLTLAHANLVDPSPFCRHLMLLTESSAALRLLFDCGLLKRDKTVVLVGSQFSRDANSELRMVRQINEIKRAMQNGLTVVLVNHEGIFPSLYDVLNMRYTTKRNADTGKTTRMLRLAVGNRSQWCAVGTGFKIVVVVESKDAYEKLDLPLLNRFEKQVLRAEDVLEDQASKQLLDELRLWTKQVELLTRVKDPFVGIYSQTLASLVHYKRMQLKQMGRDIQYPDDLQALKRDLIELMSPLAHIRGVNAKAIEITDESQPKLNEEEKTGAQPPSEAPKKAEEQELSDDLPSRIDSATVFSSDLLSSTTSNFFNQVNYCISDQTNLIVLTFSSSHDLELLLKRATEEERANIGNVEPIALGGVTSEREFVQALNRDDKTSKVCLVQCDPNTTPQETIEHARYLALHENESKRTVVFVVHLPPGGRKKRTFHVDFETKWKVTFIDDLLRPDFMSLVNTTPLDWANSIDSHGKQHLMRVVRSKLSIALALARPPLVAGGVLIGARERVQQMLRFLDEARFVECVIQGAVRALLSIFKPDEHVDMVARGDARAGTIADSLVLALETLVVRSFAMALRWYDTNFNLGLMLSPDEPIRTLWYLLWTSFSSEVIAANVVELVTPSMLTPMIIRNTGRPGLPVIGSFPWSWRVYETLEQALEESFKSGTLSVEKREDRLRGVLETAFTDRFSHLSCGHVDKYLRDICGFQENRRSELTIDEQARLVQSWLLRRDSSALDSIERVHLMFHTESWAIFALLSLRAALVQLNWPDSSIDLTRQGWLESICDFLLSERVLSNPAWPSAMQMMLPHILDLFLEMEGSIAKRKWTDVLFRFTYSEVRHMHPRHVPELLMRDQFKAVLKEGHPGTRFACIVARDVVSRAWFDDVELMMLFLSLAKDEQVDRVARVSFMEAILRHGTILPEKALDGPVLLSLAMDLVEDIPSGEDILVAPQVALDAKKHRALLRDLVSSEPMESEPLPKSIYAKAFVVNELVAQLGDFGSLQYLKTNRPLLLYLDAPRHVLDSSASSKPVATKMTAEAFQRKNSLILLIGAPLFNEATSIIEKHLSTSSSASNDKKVKKNYMDEEEEEGLDSSLAEAIRESKRDEIKELVSATVNKLHPFTRIDQTLWHLRLKTHVLSSVGDFHVMLVALLAAALAKMIVDDKISLTSTDVPMFINNFIRYGKTFSKINVNDETYFHLVDLTCARMDEPKWRSAVVEELSDKPNEQDRFLIMINVFACLLQEDQNRPSYLCELIRGRTQQLAEAHLPGMLLGEMAELRRALGYVGWWMCPNGHRYAVGECTMPMEESKCPECHAVVGGNDHTPVRGVTRLNDESEDSQPGYYSPFALSPEHPGLRSMGPGSLGFIHLVFHACAMVAALGPNAQNVRAFLAPKRRNLNQNDIVSMCFQEYRRGWKTYRAKSMSASLLATQPLDAELFFVAMLAIMTRDPSPGRIRSNADVTSLKGSAAARETFEVGISMLMTGNGYGVDQTINKQLDELKLFMGASLNRNELAAIVTHDVLLEAEALSLDFDFTSSKAEERVLWRYRVPLSYSDLVSHHEKRPSDHPFLTHFCRVELRLKLVTHLTDILQWVSVLNEALALRDRRLTRDEASRLSNEDALFTLPSNRRDGALDLLGRFCRAFNETFHLVPFLYECQRNPYLTEDGQVDLSGTRGTNGLRQEMSFETPVSFSLSAIVQGDADGPSLCLFQLVRALQQLNNTILGELEREVFARRGNMEDARLEEMDLPVTSLSTPREVVRSRLIDYDRERDLMPILACASGKAHGLGRGTPRSINLQFVEDALKRKLLTGKRPLRVVVPNFEYAGEARRAGALAGLKTRVTQVPIGRAIVGSIAAELDSDARVQPLLELVDSAMGFLSGTAGFDANTTLSDFARNVLGLTDEAWAEIAPAPVQQHVRLTHLAALFDLLEEAKHGSPLDNVKERYKKPLSPSVEADLRMRASKLNLDTLQPILKDLLVSRLVEDAFPDDAPLAEYLEYSTDLDLSSLPWFTEHFPQEITLAYAFHAYRVWMEFV